MHFADLLKPVPCSDASKINGLPQIVSKRVEIPSIQCLSSGFVKEKSKSKHVGEVSVAIVDWFPREIHSTGKQFENVLFKLKLFAFRLHNGVSFGVGLVDWAYHGVDYKLNKSIKWTWGPSWEGVGRNVVLWTEISQIAFGAKLFVSWFCKLAELSWNRVENGTIAVFSIEHQIMYELFMKCCPIAIFSHILTHFAICSTFRPLYRKILFVYQSAVCGTVDDPTKLHSILQNHSQLTVHSLTISQQQWVVRVAPLCNGTEAAQNRTALHKGKGEKTRIYSCENFCTLPDHQKWWLIIFSGEFARFVCWRCLRVGDRSAWLFSPKSTKISPIIVAN